MSTKIKTWEIKENKLKEINTSMKENNRKEAEHLEEWIKTKPEILGEDIIIIGEQVYTDSGSLDFIGIDNTGNIVIVELKRDILPREALAQAIDYASDISNWDIDRLSEICMEYNSKTLEDFIAEKFEDIDLENLVINKAQRLLLVGFEIEDSLNRMIEWLSNNYDLAINAIILQYINTSSGDELLSKTVIISEEVEKAKTNKKSFKIPMSDDPGEYEQEELKEKLIKYFNKDLYSARRIKNVLLPFLLDKDREVSREEIKEEFVRVNKADDVSQAGYFLSLISNQIGQKKKDYLRQIISYDYPNYKWEKDNFKLRNGHREIVKEVLNKINN